MSRPSPRRGRRALTAAKAVLFLSMCGGLAFVWHRGAKAAWAPPPSPKLSALGRGIERAIGPLAASKRLSVALLGKGKVVHTWRLAIRGDVPLERAVAKARAEVRRAGAKLLAVSRSNDGREASLLIIPSPRERCLLVLRSAPVRRRFAVAVVIEPKFADPEGLAYIAGLHLPLTFSLDASSPKEVEVARWLAGQGYEVVARNVSDPASLPDFFRGVLLKERPSPALMKAASERSLFFLLPKGRRVEGGRAVNLDVEIEGGAAQIREGLGDLLDLAERRGKAVGLVRLSRKGALPLVETLRGWASKGVEMLTAGKMAGDLAEANSKKRGW